MITIPSSGEFGYISDAAPQELPPNAWSFVRNARFRNGYAERVKGTTQVLNTPTFTPYFITPYRSASKFWVYAGLTKIYCDDGATKTDISPSSTPAGAIDDRWTGGAASGVLVLNNGHDQPIYWGGNTGTPFNTLTGWDSSWRAASLRPFKNYLVALDVTKSSTRYGSMVKWSAAAVPGSLPSSWDATDATKDAGEQDLAETTDFLVDSLALGDINVIYKERSMYGMQYIGQPFIWRFFRLPGEVGMLARGCGVNTPKGHVVLTAGDLILHNGQGPQSLLEGRMRRWLFNNLDQTYFGRSFLCINPTVNEVWVCFPSSGATSPNLALTWNWDSDVFGVRELQNATYGATGVVVTASDSTWSGDAGTWDSDTTVWDMGDFASNEAKLLLTQTDPIIVQAETGGGFNGSTPNCTLERTGLAFDKPDVVKTVRSVIPRFDASGGTVLSIQVGAQMDAEGPVTWSPAFTYTVGTSRKADCFATGRFLAFRITSATVQPWRLKSFDMEITEHGLY